MVVDIPDVNAPVVTVTVPPSWGFPANPVLQISAAIAAGANNSDAELVVIAGTTVYSFWQFTRTGPNSATANSWAMSDVVRGSGFAILSPFMAAGVSGIGSSPLGGLIRKVEVDTGRIDHGISLAAVNTVLKPGFVAPAVSSDVPATATGFVQEGEYLAIPLDTAMPAGLSDIGAILFRAMQEYGVYIVDQSYGASTLDMDTSFSAAAVALVAHDANILIPLLQKVS